MEGGDSVLIQLRNVSVGYGRRRLAEGVDWEIENGSLWGIVGPNGAGKTTLLRVLLGLIAPLGGRVIRRRGLRFGYVKQRDTLNECYPFTVAEVVLTGRYGLMSCLSRPRPEDHAAVAEALERTGIIELKDQPVRELSGGQKQRVLIARALAARPDVIVLDEPTNDMDIAGEQSVLSLVLDIHEHFGAAVVIVSHLLHSVLQIAESLVFIKDGRYGVFSKAEFITENHLERFYDMPIRIVEHPEGGYSVVSAAKSPGRKEG
jgi:zinc transport system ATP-binding protein